MVNFKILSTTLILMAMPLVVGATALPAKPGNLKPATPGTGKLASDSAEWKASKLKLEELRKKFVDPQISKEQKVKLLPQTNALLSRIQDLKLTPAERKEQISVAVQVLVAASPYDFANSNADTLFYQYKANKPAYDEALRVVPTELRKDIQDTFEELHEVEADKQEGASGAPSPTSSTEESDSAAGVQ